MWFRGYMKGRSTLPWWVKDLKDAKIYASVSPARSTVTRNTNMKAFELDPPYIVELHVTEMKVVDQKKRLSDLKLNKLEAAAQKAFEFKKSLLEDAQRDFDKAAARLKSFKKD